MPAAVKPAAKNILAEIMRPRIWQNGLLLVFLPLLINFIWIGMLNDALQKSLDLLDQERYQAQLQTRLNGLVFTYAEAFSGLITGFIHHHPHYLNEGEHQFLIVKNEFVEINKMTAGDPEVHHWVAKAQSEWDQVFGALKVLTLKQIANADDDMPWLGQVKNAQNWSKDFNRINQELFGALAKQQIRLEHLRSQEVTSRQIVQTTVLVGLGANLLVALFLLVIFVRNITERVKLLMENAHRLPQSLPLEHQVRGADELAELDRVLHRASTQLAEAADFRRSLMQMMAHDLRTPLTACMVSVDLITRGEKATMSENGQKQVRSITRSIERLINLINDLLTLESLEAGKLDIKRNPENLKEICDTAVESLSSLAELKSIEIICQSERQYVLADRERLMQIMVNLLSNAIKFSPVGQPIVVSIERLTDSVKVAVRDHGDGISSAEQKRLFQKFYQSEAGKKAGGTGLGLAICKLIAEAHGGAIGVDTAPGGGALFWFSVPIGDDPNEDD